MQDSRMMPKVEMCEAIIGRSFNDKNLCWEAVQAAGSGVSYIGERCIREGNKRLAVVGDIALNMVLAPDWHASEASKGLSIFSFFLREEPRSLEFPFEPLKSFGGTINRSMDQNPQ